MPFPFRPDFPLLAALVVLIAMAGSSRAESGKAPLVLTVYSDYV